MKTTAEKFEEFIKIVSQIRRKCPWDREQTFASLRPYLREEVEEVIEAIETEDFSHLPEELGDMLLHIVMLSVFAQEKGLFSMEDVLRSATDKMIRRHPHVFGKSRARTKAGVLRNWKKIKRAEQAKKRAIIPKNKKHAS